MELNIQDTLTYVNRIAVRASEIVLEYYHKGFNVEYKSDKTPLTSADTAAHNYICSELKEKWPDIPIISEEGDLASYAIRQTWDSFWLVDPIDGTSEFVKKNGEFTINIALIQKGAVILGVVIAPVLQKHYFGALGVGSVLRDVGGDRVLSVPSNIMRKPQQEQGLVILASKSHREKEIDTYLQACPGHSIMTIGSSLKFCCVAEGVADLYPRLAPLKEWDIAAGHAIIKFSGRNVYHMGTKQEFQYNNETMTVKPFEAY